MAPLACDIRRNPPRLVAEQAQDQRSNCLICYSAVTALREGLCQNVVGQPARGLPTRLEAIMISVPTTRPKAWFILAACLLVGVTGANASTVSFVVSTPSTVEVGTFFDMTVTAFENGNVVTNYPGTIELSPSAGSLSGASPEVATNGVATFDVAFVGLSGTSIQTITADETTNITVTGTSNPITVTDSLSTPAPAALPAEGGRLIYFPA